MPTPEFEAVLLKIGISLALGFLVGLQRERSSAHLAGVRTFPLITVFGTLCGFLARDFGGWVPAIGLAALAAIVVVGNVADIRSGVIDPGLTTEIAILVMYAVGAYLVNGHMAIAITVGGAVAILLFLKPQMHAFARRMSDKDFKAIMQFVVITLVILPVLPNKYFGPYGVLNLFHIWVMVSLIVGISLAGYVIYKIWGQNAGTLVGGILGGLISSTATTASFSRRVRETPALRGIAVLIILIASTVVFGRVLVIVGIRGPKFFPVAIAPLGIMLGVLILLSLGCWLFTAKQNAKIEEPRNPCELTPALLFGAAYALVLLAVAFAKESLGQSGLYSVAALSGLTDMDAITLSVTDLVADGKLPPGAGWRAILIASLSNMVFKSAIAGFLGGRGLFFRIASAFAFATAAGVALFVFWPG